MIETYKIKEFVMGHYVVILDFPSITDLDKIIDASYKYVWGIDYEKVGLNWAQIKEPLFDENLPNGKQHVRNMQTEFLVDSGTFLENLPFIKQSLHLIQTNHIPPYYLDINRLKGRQKYNLLKEKVDYLFEIEIQAAADYSQLVSTDIDFLEKVIRRFTII